MTASHPLGGCTNRGLTGPWGLSWPLLAAAGAFIICLQPSLLNDGDTYWHLAAANWMFEHLAVPDKDPFSHTMGGAPWLAHEWLAELILGAAYRLGGWPGLVALSAAALAAAIAILCRYLQRHLEPIHVLAMVAVSLCLCAPHLLARPHTLAFPLLVAWTVALLLAREQARAPVGGWAALMVLWANLHASFVLGLVLAGFFAVEALLDEHPASRLAVAKEWGRFVLLSLAAAFITPYGLAGLAFVFSVHDMEHAMNAVAEWKSPDFHRFQPLEMAMLLGGMAVLGRGLRLPWLRAVLVLALLHLALKHVRYADIFGLLVPLVAAEPAGRQLAASAGTGSDSLLDRWFGALAAPAKLSTVAVSMVLLLLITWGIGRIGHLRPAANITPEAAVRAGQDATPGGKVLNAYQFGGYLAYSGVPPFIDGRNDVYGDRFLGDYLRAIEDWETNRLSLLLEQHDIAWTLFPPKGPAVALLDRLPGWRRLHADNVAVVHVRASF